MEGLGYLNHTYGRGDRRIVEAFGSLPSFNPFGTARPSFRLKDRSKGFLRLYVQRLREYGIDLNYTLNVSFVDPRVLDMRKLEIATFLQALESMGIRRVTIAHPLVGQIVSRHSDLNIEVSTIAQIRSVRQLSLWKERCPTVDKLCVDVFSNRDWHLMESLSRAAREMEIRLEILVNEFCVHDCIDRNHCYDIHSIDVGPENRKLFNSYPMGNCMRERITNPVEWLRARFVLPQWVDWYHERLGIDSFKISGRTHPTKYILWVTEQYLKGHYGGNLLELWADVENIGRAHEEWHSPRVFIDCSKFPDDFLNHYLTPGAIECEDDFLAGVYGRVLA